MDRSVGFRPVENPDKVWEGTVTEPSDPQLWLNPVPIDADRFKYLYVVLGCPTATSIQVFYAADAKTGFSELRSVRTIGLDAGDGPAAYRFTLRWDETWRGAVGAMRIDVDGTRAGDLVRFYGAAVSETAADPVSGFPVIAVEHMCPGRAHYERMAAWHHTLVSTEEQRGHSYVATYVLDRPWQYTKVYVVAKLIAGIESEARRIDNGHVSKVEDFPGGVEATLHSERADIQTELVPLVCGRDSDEWDGAALYQVEATPAAPLLVRCGAGGLFDKWALDGIRSQNIGVNGDTACLEHGLAFLTSAGHALAVAVATDGELSIGAGDNGGQQLFIRFGRGAGYILVSYAASRERAATLARTPPQPARDAVSAYYDQLLRNRIETPEPVLDAAFRSALYTLEYNWIAPYGWNECIHHWLALWHMQHTAGAEWIGQPDRSRACNLATAAHLFPDGAVPQFFPGGQTRRDFGGSNQFFAWQLRHYWQFTADTPAIELLAPVVGRVVDQTFGQYDPDNDLLLAWGQQIGNQEDYISTPFNGTSPTVEGLNMLRTQAIFAEAASDAPTAQACGRKIALASEQLRRRLWQPDLGRFIFYRDPQGVARLDGQYHTFIYPAIWDVLDPLDRWTSIRHLRDRFMGDGGEVYCSNNLPTHLVSTTGVQAGAAQQPWAALGLAAVGLRNETYRPLLAAARWVMDEHHRGAWPEIASEPVPAYFSPPAGLFVYAVVEALFGLEMHRPEGYLRVAPSFPDSWPGASLDLAEFSAEYRREGPMLRYTVRSQDPLARRLRWPLPPGGFSDVRVDGRSATYDVEPAVNCVILCIDTPPATETTFSLCVEPAEFRVDSPGSVAEGDRFQVEVGGCAVEAVDDRCGALKGITIEEPRTLRAQLSETLLGPYARYGRLGLLNFARRSFFLYCRTKGGQLFWVPVDLTVLPRYEVAARGDIQPGEAGVRLAIRNNTTQPLKGTAYLETADRTFPFLVDVPARSEYETAISLPAHVAALFSSGDNKAAVVLPGGHTVALTLTASKIFASEQPLAEFMRARLAAIALPQQAMTADADWRNLRPWYAYGHMPWAALKPPLEGVAGQDTVGVDGLPHVFFKLDAGRMAPVSWRMKRPVLNIDLPDGRYKKLYVLVIPFLDNHDMFAPVARITLELANGSFIVRTLHFPGDLDAWAPEAIVGVFSTARGPQRDRFGLLPLLAPAAHDWDVGSPPDFPQPGLWAACRAIRTPTSVMNVVEMDLGRPMDVAAVSIETLGVDPALGVVAITAEVDNGYESLRDTAWFPRSSRAPTPSRLLSSRDK